MLDRVRERLRDDVVQGGLHGCRRPLGDVHAHVDGDRRPAGERAQRRTEPADRELRRVNAAGEVLHLLDHRLELAFHPLEPFPGGLLRHRHVGAEPLQMERQGDQPLLCAVVQVTLDPPPRFVSRLDDSGAGRDQLRLRLCARDRGADQLGERRQPGLDLLTRHRGREHSARVPAREERQRLAPLPEPDPDHPPDVAVHDDRRTDGRREPGRAHGLRDDPAPVGEVVDPDGRSGLAHGGREARFLHRPAAADLEHRVIVRGHDLERVAGLVADDGDGRAAQDAGSLVGDRGEQLPGGCPFRRERRDTPKRCLRIGQPPQLVSRVRIGDGDGSQFGEVAQTRLRSGGKRLGALASDPHQSPHRPVHDDRRSDQRPDRRVPHGGSRPPAEDGDVVDAHRPPRGDDRRVQSGLVERPAAADREHRRVQRGDDGGRPVRVDPLDRDRVDVDRLGDGARDGGEEVARRRALGHKRGDVPQGSLLSGEPSQRRPLGRVRNGHRDELGEVLDAGVCVRPRVLLRSGQEDTPRHAVERNG